MIFFMKKGILLIVDIIFDVIQEMIILIWMSMENILIIVDMEFCCSDLNVLDGFCELLFYQYINLLIIFLFKQIVNRKYYKRLEIFVY